MSDVMKNSLARLYQDKLRAELGEALHIRVNPLLVRNYALPDYVRFKRIGPKALRRWLGADLLYRFVKARAPLVLPGDWDLHATAVADTPTHRFIAELVAARYDYRSTATYAKMVKDIAAGHVIKYKKRRIDCQDRIDEHFRYYVGVCESMAANGYLSAGNHDHICVMIGRDGKLVKEEKGRHRLAIAQLVGVPAVPVFVRHVHPLWLDSLRETRSGSDADIIRTGLKQFCHQ